MIKINLPLDQSCLKMLNLRPPLLIPNWHSRSRYDGMTFPLLCSNIMCSVDKFDLPWHAWVLSIFGLTIIGFENVMVSYISYFLGYEWYFCLIQFSPVWYDKIIDWLCCLHWDRIQCAMFNDQFSNKISAVTMSIALWWSIWLYELVNNIKSFWVVISRWWLC